MNLRVINEGVKRYKKQGTIYWFRLDGISDRTQRPYSYHTQYGVKVKPNGSCIIVDKDFNTIFDNSIKTDLLAAYKSFYASK
jgi:hypothetical protein